MEMDTSMSMPSAGTRHLGRPRRRLTVVAILALAAIAGVAWVSPAGPFGQAPVTGQAPAPTQTPPQDALVIHGRGANAAEALALATARLPFTHVPAYIPAGFQPAVTEARIEQSGHAVLDVLYLGANSEQVQLFQANSPNLKPTAASVVSEQQVTLRGRTWRYLLLQYPQPNGSRVMWHFLERPFDGTSYISLGSSATNNPGQDRSELERIAASLP